MLNVHKNNLQIKNFQKKSFHVIEQIDHYNSCFKFEFNDNVSLDMKIDSERFRNSAFFRILYLY